jgi:hypothetical protein
LFTHIKRREARHIVWKQARNKKVKPSALGGSS